MSLIIVKKTHLNIDKFLRKVLAYDIKERYSALEAANDLWINN